MPTDPSDHRTNGLDQSITHALSRELRDAAQPLTILQGILEMMLESDCEKEVRNSTSLAMQQLRRLEVCFDHLRRLAHLQRPAHDVEEIAPSCLVEGVMAELQSSFSAAGIEWGLIKDGTRADERKIKVSRDRVTSAFRLIFTALLKCLKEGDKVCVHLEPCNESILCRIVPDTNQLHTLPWFPSRPGPRVTSARFDLVHALLVSAGGNFHCEGTPYSIDILLPKAKAENLDLNVPSAMRAHA